MKNLLILSVLVVVTSCSGQSDHFRKSFNEYINSKSKFETKFIAHFPDTINTIEFTTVCNTNIEKNDVGLLLYEYNVNVSEIEKVKSSLNHYKAVHFTIKDSCLLIVNRFETLSTYENFEIVTLIDSLKLNNICYQDVLPIPNFIDYSNRNDKSDLKLPSGFDMYVLEAKVGNHFKEYKLGENNQMPDNWKNGYSRGVAINEKEKTVIYWSIIW